jgi:predicted secreted protein
MAIVLGLDAVLMRGTAGSQGTTDVKNVKDLTLNLESGEADVTTRATAGWRASVATLKEASLEFSILYDTEDTDYNAFATAYFNNTPLSLFVSDGNGTGLDADFSITGFSIEQPLEEALSVSITAKPTASERAPQWVNGGGGA